MAEDRGCEKVVENIESNEDYQYEDYEIEITGFCNDCKHLPATYRFLHLDGREFFLCIRCFYAADHESDYGNNFDDEDRTDNEQQLYDLGYDECCDTDSDDEQTEDVPKTK